MKTKTQPKPAVAGAGYKEIERGDYRTSEIGVEGNFRKHFNKKALAQLAENIGKVGVLQPVILRRGDAKHKYPILVAGERRLRAAQLAGLKEIPGRILDITAEQAQEVQAMENLHRKDLSPIEEARAFKVLLDQKGHTLEQAEDLANRVSKSVNYIYRAVRLLELPEDIIKKIDTREWTPAHGHQLLRVPKDKIIETIQKAAGGDPRDVTAFALRNAVDHQLGSKLDAKGFPKTVPYAGKEACTACVYNSGNQGQLFDGAEKGNCTYKECFDLKMKQFLVDKEQALRNEHGEDFLGIQEHCLWHGSTSIKGYKVIGHKDEKQTKEAQKTDAKYAMEKNGTVWVLTENKNTRGSSGNSDTNRITPKQKFIRMETYKTLFEAALRSFDGREIKADHLAVIAKALEPGHYDTKIPMTLIPVEAKSKNSWDPKYQYEKLGTSDLERLIFMMALDFRCSLSSNDPDPKHFSVCGINAKDIIAKAKKEAALAWDAQKGKKKAVPAGAAK